MQIVSNISGFVAWHFSMSFKNGTMYYQKLSGNTYKDWSYLEDIIHFISYMYIDEDQYVKLFFAC